MSLGTAIVVVVAILAFTVLKLARHYSKQERLAEPPPRAEAAAERRELEELRERVKVLEQITVDGREARDIADRIEQLRDR